MSVRARRAILALCSLLVLAVVLVVVINGQQSSHGGVAGSTASVESGGESADAPEATASTGFDGAAVPAGTPAQGFSLVDQHGRTVSLASLRGQVTVLAFPYSTCGATCVVIADQIRGALEELPHPVPVVFISANPAADTPAQISRFLAQVGLSGRVRYLTGPVGTLAPIWRAYRVVPASAGQAAFDSHAMVLLLDRDGRKRVEYGLEQLTAEALAHDIRKLESESG
jgi:protein SCO1